MSRECGIADYGLAELKSDILFPNSIVTLSHLTHCHIMKLVSSLACLFLAFVPSFAQDQWTIAANKIDPSTYYGITVANGMIGIVS